MARLFGRDRSLLTPILKTLPVELLGGLCRLGYVEVRLRDDVVHEGCFTPGIRDDAESARSTILTALTGRPEVAAYEMVQAIGRSGISGIRSTRFRELAHHMAETACQLARWEPEEVRTLEEGHVLPIKNGDQLLDAVCDTLDEICRGLAQDDAAPRRLLARAQDENEVQEWLADQIKTRSSGRVHVNCEPQVKGKKRPDTIAASTSCTAQVAIEIKHGNKRWTVPQLERALTHQLAELYLLPEHRRHGVLVISLHRPRTWREPGTRRHLSFNEVIARLQALAEQKRRNEVGEIVVRVVGVNAAG